MATQEACRALRTISSSLGAHLLRLSMKGKRLCQKGEDRRRSVPNGLRAGRCWLCHGSSSECANAHPRTVVAALCRGPLSPATIVTTKLGRSRAQLYASAA